MCGAERAGRGEALPIPKQGVPQLGSCLGSCACLGVWDGLEQREARGRETGSVALWPDSHLGQWAEA